MKPDWEKTLAKYPDSTMMEVDAGFVRGLIVIKSGKVVDASPGFTFMVGRRVKEWQRELPKLRFTLVPRD